MSAGFVAALGQLGLAERDDPKTMVVAKLVIEFAKSGERDPERLCTLALQEFAQLLPRVSST